MWRNVTCLESRVSDEALSGKENIVVLITNADDSKFTESVLTMCRANRISTLSIAHKSSAVLLGPFETPDQSGCITCLNLRWENTVLRVTLQETLKNQLRGQTPRRMPLAMTDSELTDVANLALDEIRRIILGKKLRTDGHVGIYKRARQTEWVPVVPSHDCPRCNLMPDDGPEFGKIQFQSQVMEDLESFRVHQADFESLRRLYVHKEIGYISAIHQRSTPKCEQASAEIRLPGGSLHSGYGSGLSVTGAIQTAMLEALERVCAIESTNRRPTIHDAYANIYDHALLPTAVGMHDASFYEREPMYDPFHPDKFYSWIWGYSTKQREPILVPEQIAHYGRTHDAKRFVAESSNGCALGGTFEEATLYGLFEVYERDGMLNMWYGRIPVPELSLGPRCPEKVCELTTMLENKGYHVRFFDIAHDLDVPAILAVAIGQDNQVPRVACGSSCHLLPYEAVYGALRELAVQVLYLEGLSEKRRQEGLDMLEHPEKIREILDHVVTATQPEAYHMWDFLLRRTAVRAQPIEEVFAAAADRYHIESRDIAVILSALLDDLHRRDFDAIVINQTNVELQYGNLFAAKVIVPGMTPITFGYGFRRTEGLCRVFDLPRRLGYSDKALRTEDLNSHCHPFA